MDTIQFRQYVEAEIIRLQNLLKGITEDTSAIVPTSNPITLYKSIFDFIKHKYDYISGSHCGTLIVNAIWLLKCCGTNVDAKDFFYYNDDINSKDVTCLEDKQFLLKLCDKYFRQYNNNICSYDSYSKRKILLNSFINYAVEYDYLRKNVFNTLTTLQKVKRSKTVKEEVSPKNVSIILRRAFDIYPLHGLVLALSYYTGMRFGEAIGLKYSDIKDNVIYIRRARSLYRKQYTGRLTSYKYSHLKGRIRGEYRTAWIIEPLEFYINEVLKLNYNNKSEYIFKPHLKYRSTWCRVMEQLGYDRKVFKPNYLRSLHITEMAKNFILTFVGKKTGTSTRMIHDYYLIVSEYSEDIIINKMNNIFRV